MIGLALIGAAALAADRDPRCDSTNANDLLACAKEAHEKADRELNEQWNRMHPSDSLIEAQRTWIAWRDLECTARNAAIEGREGPIWHEACLAQLSEQRTQELRDDYRWLAEPETTLRDGGPLLDKRGDCDPSGKGEAGYRQCLLEQAEKSLQRVQSPLARNRREATEKDSQWEEYRRETGQARVLSPTHLEALERSQTAWEAYVDAQCTLEGYTALGGTAERAYALTCQNRLNLQRLKDLRSPFVLESQRLEPVPDE